MKPRYRGYVIDTVTREVAFRAFWTRPSYGEAVTLTRQVWDLGAEDRALVGVEEREYVVDASMEVLGTEKEGPADV